MAKGSKKPKLELIEPTPEQMAGAVFQIEDVIDKHNGVSSIAIGKAYRRRPMIDTLRAQEILTADQHKALKHYRHHADIADRSPTRDSLNFYRGGSGMGPGVAILHAKRVRDDCERAAGTLCDILRAVVVEDMSLSQWAIATAGSVEEWYERKGKTVCQIKPRRNALERAQLEIRIVAGRVMGELDA